MLNNRDIGGIKAYYRPDTSDERALIEVIEKTTYRRKGIGFDVEAGEHWLDLGANIGAFALYCKLRGATAECYEPQPDCFSILKKNVPYKGFTLAPAAVTLSKEAALTLYSSPRKGEHYRGTTFKRNGYKQEQQVPNLYAGFLPRREFSGVKMDIEGGEGPLLDAGLLPKCEKLCLEYHTSVDDDLSHFFRRMWVLKKLFHNVKYTSEFDKAKREGLTHFKSFVDRVVFAWGAK